MGEPRILYFNHDNPKPSGGVRTIYSHVRHLVQNGLLAFVVHGTPQFRPTWFSEEVPILYYQQGLTLYPDDVVVIPEESRSVLDVARSIPARKIVFCQNHYYVFAGLKQNRSWEEAGVEKVFASSDVIAGFIESNMGWSNVPVVHYAFDRGMFKPLRKELKIAYMPRKRRLEADFILNLTTRLLGGTANVLWVSLDEASEADVAKALGESAIFLSLGRLEGFGLPPLEAMACGCVVVGYHGQGGLEYATTENGFWCQEGDPVACAQMLQKVVHLVQTDSPEIERVIDCGSRTVGRYTPDRQEKELLTFVRSVLNRDQDAEERNR